jgi:hypothetical protein
MVHMGLPVSDGSENIITPPEEWKSKHKWTSSEDSIPEEGHWNRGSPPPHGKAHVQDDENEEEDEEEDEEDDDEDKEEEDDDDDDDDE